MKNLSLASKIYRDTVIMISIETMNMQIEGRPINRTATINRVAGIIVRVKTAIRDTDPRNGEWGVMFHYLRRRPILYY
jgi:hypothetical protein